MWLLVEDCYIPKCKVDLVIVQCERSCPHDDVGNTDVI